MLNHETRQMPVAHAYNSSYSGGRDQEDCGSKSETALVVAQGVSPLVPEEKK
jgi:hypothetical protein